MGFYCRTIIVILHTIELLLPNWHLQNVLFQSSVWVCWLRVGEAGVPSPAGEVPGEGVDEEGLKRNDERVGASPQEVGNQL